jgi:hypothetical protein
MPVQTGYSFFQALGVVVSSAVGPLLRPTLNLNIDAGSESSSAAAAAAAT